MNIEGDDDSGRAISHETEEIGGFLLMLTAVPAMSEYDYGASYLLNLFDVHPPDHLEEQAVLRS